MNVFPIVHLFYPELQHLSMALPTFGRYLLTHVISWNEFIETTRSVPFLISKLTKFNYYIVYYFISVIIPQNIQQLVQRRVHSGSWFQRDRSSSWRGGVAQVSVMAAEVGSLTFSTVSMKERQESRSEMWLSTLKAHSFPTPMIYFLHQGHTA